MEPVRRRDLEEAARPQVGPIDDLRSLQWGFFDYLPVTVQDVTGEVLMVQYLTEEGLERSLQEKSLWLWSRSRERFWMAGRNGGGYDLIDLRANCMGDSLLAIVDSGRRLGCHLGNRSCFSVRISLDGSLTPIAADDASTPSIGSTPDVNTDPPQSEALATAPADLHPDDILVGGYRMRPSGRRARVTGSTTGRTTSTGFARRYRVLGPNRLHVVIEDVEWKDGTRDVRLHEVRRGPELMHRLADHCRLTVQTRTSRTLYVELRRATAKLLTTKGGANALEKVSLGQLTRSAGEPVEQLLKRAGARRVGRREELINDRSSHRDKLCTTFPPSARHVPAVSYVITRIIPVHRQSLAVVASRVPTRKES